MKFGKSQLSCLKELVICPLNSAEIFSPFTLGRHRNENEKEKEGATEVYAKSILVNASVPCQHI